MSGLRDLCTVDQVIGYAPGYSAEDDSNGEQTLATLQAMITAESVTQHRRGREYVSIDAPGDSTRTFDLTETHLRRRKVRIGDCAQIGEMWIADNLGVTVETLDPANYVQLPRIRQEWEPIRILWFPTTVASPATLGCGWTLNVTATWGFPSVPADVAQAVAKLVLVRYADEIEGGALSEALVDVRLNQLQDNAIAVLADYADPPIA